MFTDFSNRIAAAVPTGAIGYVTRRHAIVAVLLVYTVSPYEVVAQTPSEDRKAVILSTMAEAALASVSLIEEKENNIIEKLFWTASYSERNWKFYADGYVGDNFIEINMSGYLWGGDDENWNINYSGLGLVGEEPVQINGRADWLYDVESMTHQSMDFSQVMKFGENSSWAWIVGAEIVFGGTIGAIGGAGAPTIATAGAAIVAAPVLATQGAVLVAGAMVTMSLGIISIDNSNEPTPAPEVPQRPIRPDAGEDLEPREGYIIVAVSNDGLILGSGLSGYHILSAQFDETNTVAGSVELN